ncbi:hypothetical protein PUNSTDRAFT_95600 [Punctularia strigosozonata HHB-11173 SS5]|uniref:uncharacterized protein n=1 Tax=Punctularia strigosozonata (strain HHB-11173) TaxID=741275 RepID=UPI0004417F30|nr:uncharacterized protein PUNSTDRAFT_95600 [Punctularia strigosozonata HHB-11173 SS5]EIN14061.1 hypothetical protein PUNSTDRAFT_95600 [Punctularia strigosozonata HHB-11173 SS5]
MFTFRPPLPPLAHAPALPPPALPSVIPASAHRLPDRQVIDLTGSPSPPATPPQHSLPLAPGGLPSDLPPKTPVCIGMLSVTALVLYPIPYLRQPEPAGTESDWAVVRLQHEPAPGKSETINIKAPNWKAPNGEMVSGETFGVVEQKVASSLGPMLGKGLIKLDGKVRRGMPNLPILPLQLLVYTPKGNIPVVGGYLSQHGLLLDHPTLSQDYQRLSSAHYYNPHNPPPGGHARNLLPNAPNRLGYASSANSRWSSPAVNCKSVEVQRSQAEELFKSLRNGDELEETEPSPCIATKLYSHQKKAITFLLERERERPGPNGTYSSLWQARKNPFSGQPSWQHLVTQKEVFREPQEAKGAILADDMGLGKTITCVSLIAATLDSAAAFASSPLLALPPPPQEHSLTADHFAGSVWGMPEGNAESAPSCSIKSKGKAAKEQDRLESDYLRACRIKTKSRATLIICPLSTISNWEEQFKEHWRGPVTVVGGTSGNAASKCSTPSLSSLSLTQSLPPSQPSLSKLPTDNAQSSHEGRALRVYVYHGNARRPDPSFLADFDAVITTFSTLATEYSKQNRSLASSEADEDEDDEECDGLAEYDGGGHQVVKLSGAKGKKRKKLVTVSSASEASSALQSIHWFRVVLDEAHSIKETGTVGCRASCDLIADRRLCLTGTPVQNKLDDVFALVKFLRLEPFDDKNVWTEFIGTPVKYGQPLGVARLQTIMKCITLRRTKETRAQDGQKILTLPPRRDELRLLKFDEQEQAIYNQFYNESKAEFTELSDRNEVMKNYVGILQKILRLRQICDHYELVEGKGLFTEGSSQDAASVYEDVVAAIAREGITPSRAAAVFALLRESATAQCVECGSDLGGPDGAQNDGAMDPDNSTGPKRGRKGRTMSRAPTRQNSPSGPRPVMTRCQHLFCIECYRRSVCPGWPNASQDTLRACSACQAALGPSDVVEIIAQSSVDASPKKKPAKREKRRKGASLADFHPSTKIKALLGDLMQFSRANPHSANYDPTSIEVQMVDDQGNEVDDGVVKTVVFSQWTTMLDKIEDALEMAGIRYERLDGTMKRDDRTRAMETLKHDPACEVLLVSLKAGGVGLNLTAAQRVYLMDPYWNPAVENQAVDRIHRLGQTRPVTTIKLIIENTIEARLLEVQRKKTALANMTLGQNYSKAEMLQRRMEELQQLFG